MAHEKSISQEFDDLRFPDVSRHARLAIGLYQAGQPDTEVHASAIYVDDEPLTTLLGKGDELSSLTQKTIGAVRRSNPNAAIQANVLSDDELLHARREQFEQIDLVLNAQFGRPKFLELES